MLSFLKVLLLILAAHVTQRPLRNLLTVIGVALGVSASVAVRTANIDVLRSFEQAVLSGAGPTTLELSGGELGLDERLIIGARNVPGVMSASPVILQTAVRMDGGRPAQAVQVLGLDLLAEAHSRGFRLSRQPSETELETVLNPETVLLGRKLAIDWNLTVGDKVDLQVGPRRVTCRVTGILQDASDRASSWDRLAVMDIAAAQVTFGMVGRLDRIDLVTDAERPVEDVAQAVRAVVPPHVTVQRPTSRTRQVEQMVRAFRLNLTVLSWVGLPDLHHDGLRRRAAAARDRDLSSNWDDAVARGRFVSSRSRPLWIVGRSSGECRRHVVGSEADRACQPDDF
jgi:putative ABC transport system permease protein